MSTWLGKLQEIAKHLVIWGIHLIQLILYIATFLLLIFSEKGVDLIVPFICLFTALFLRHIVYIFSCVSGLKECEEKDYSSYFGGKYYGIKTFFLSLYNNRNGHFNKVLPKARTLVVSSVLILIVMPLFGAIMTPPETRTKLMKKLNSCVAVTNILGKDIEPYYFGLSMGNSQDRGGFGHKSWTIPVSGEKGKGLLTYNLEKHGGRWSLINASIKTGGIIFPLGKDINLMACRTIRGMPLPDDSPTWIGKNTIKVRNHIRELMGVKSSVEPDDLLNNPASNAADRQRFIPEPQITISDSKIGTGDPVIEGDTVTIYYYAQKKPLRETPYRGGKMSKLTFTVGEGKVIKGLEQGVIGMRIDGYRHLIIPKELVIAEKDKGRKYPKSALKVEVSLTSVEVKLD